MSTMPDERELLRRLAALPRELTPRRDVWPLISARIAEPPTGYQPVASRFRRWPMAAAASFIIIVAAGLALKKHWDHPVAARLVPAVADLQSIPAGRADFAVSTTTGELEYRAALREFMALNAMSGTGQQAEPKWFDQGWSALRRVELQLTAALRADPDNDFLKSCLVALRARQIELLKQFAAVEQTSWRNRI